MSILQPKSVIKVKIKSFNENIVCFLCSGYLVRPVAITECLHTFCRSCIVKYLTSASEFTCPYCGVLIHETNPWDLLKEDKTLEDIMFKIVPRLCHGETKSRAEFYRSLGITDPEEQEDVKFSKEIHVQDELDKETNDKQGSKKDGGKIPTPKKTPKNINNSERFGEESQMGFSLNCLRPASISSRSCKYFRQLEKRFIRCSSHLTVAHLKKYLQNKLALPENCEVEILCNGEIMGKHHTLEFIYMTRWRYKESILTLDYRPKIELTEL